ncbi:hypothetical protein AgCh_028166 [Apium graveolens]
MMLAVKLTYKITRCDVFDIHNELVPYAKAWTWQKSIVEERKKLVDKNEDFCDSVIVLQHPFVYTLGIGSSEDHIKGIKKFYQTDRGGEVTYHGPGQNEPVVGEEFLGSQAFVYIEVIQKSKFVDSSKRKSVMEQSDCLDI